MNQFSTSGIDSPSQVQRRNWMTFVEFLRAPTIALDERYVHRCYAHWFAPVNRLMPFRSAFGLTKKFKEETLSAADFRDPTLSPADIYGRKRVTELPATATRPIFAPKGLATCLINGLMNDALLCYILQDATVKLMIRILFCNWLWSKIFNSIEGLTGITLRAKGPKREVFFYFFFTDPEEEQRKIGVCDILQLNKTTGRALIRKHTVVHYESDKSVVVSVVKEDASAKNESSPAIEIPLSHFFAVGRLIPRFRKGTDVASTLYQNAVTLVPFKHHKYVEWTQYMFVTLCLINLIIVVPIITFLNTSSVFSSDYSSLFGFSETYNADQSQPAQPT